MNHEQPTGKEPLMILNTKTYCFVIFLMLCFMVSSLPASDQPFLEITKAEKRQDGKILKSYKRGEIIPGVCVNERKDIRIGERMFTGDRVSVPKNIFVTFESSNGNFVETKSRAIFVVSSLMDEGESYNQQEGVITYRVIQPAIDFFNVWYKEYLAAVEGTVFEVNVDLENKEIEFTADEGEVAVTREYKVKAGNEELEGLKELVMISDRRRKKEKDYKDEADFTACMRSLTRHSFSRTTPETGISSRYLSSANG